MRVLLDTNVLLAAFISEGLCHQVYSACLSQHEIVASEYLLIELTEVLARKTKMPPEQRARILTSVRDNVQLVLVPEDVQRVCRDPKDDAIVAAAQLGKCHLLITGDDDLLVLKRFKNGQIIKPRDFVKAYL